MEEYRYAWKVVAAATLYNNCLTDENCDDCVDISFSRALISDFDLQKKSDKGSEVEVQQLQKEMEDASLTSPTSGEKKKKKSKKECGLPNSFGGKYMRNVKRSNVSWKDEYSFEQYYQDMAYFYTYRTWLNKYESIMDKEEVREHETKLAASSEDLIGDKTSIVREVQELLDAQCGRSGEQEDFAQLFSLHCTNVESGMRKHFLRAQGMRAAKRCSSFIKEIHSLGFVMSPAEKVNEEEEKGSGDRVKSEEVDAHPFEDVSYEIYDPYLADRSLVLEEKAEEDDKGKVEEGDDVPAEDDEWNNINFDVDADKDAHLFAKNAVDLFSKDALIKKYWYQRYRLFTRLDEGVLMDREGWFSVTPERIAEHIADRVVRGQGLVVLDAFTGVGGNAIQFALKGAYVIAVDMDATRLKCARENARVYGVEDRCQFILGDFFTVAAALSSAPSSSVPRVDAVFLSPPWGGPSYLRSQRFDISRDMQPDGFKIFEAAKKISPNIAYFLPRHTCMKQVASLAGKGSGIEVEQASLNHKIKTITVYYGDLKA